MTCLEDFLQKAANYESEGNEEKAQKFFELAERFENCKKKIQDRMLNR